MPAEGYYFWFREENEFFYGKWQPISWHRCRLDADQAAENYHRAGSKLVLKDSERPLLVVDHAD